MEVAVDDDGRQFGGARCEISAGYAYVCRLCRVISKAPSQGSDSRGWSRPMGHVIGRHEKHFRRQPVSGDWATVVGRRFQCLGGLQQRGRW
jgi:hypothetical protein